MKSKSPPFHSSTAAAAAAETEKAINIYKEQTAAVAHTKIATKLKEEREREGGMTLTIAIHLTRVDD